MVLKNVYIVAAKRTPFGSFGGKLKDISATDLCAHAAKATLTAAKLEPALVDVVQVGNVASTSPDGAYIARHVQLKAGIPQDKPALTINRLCGSGFQSVVGGMHEILLGHAEIALCGGAENMSQSPLAVYGHQARFGVGLGAGLNLQDTLWSALTDSYVKTPMGMTAENLAEKYDISREDCDVFALQSQTRWAEAQAKGWLEAEVAPLDVQVGRQTEAFAVDESPRVVDRAKLAKLKPVFKKDGVVTAGNASGISDGAGAVLLASEDAVKQHGLVPLAQVVSYHVSGVDPTIMGIGPVPAITGALKRAGLKKSDIDMFDINEAFAAQWLSCVKELELDPEIVNQSGGATALGHPLGASGSRITAHLVHALQRTGKRYAVGSACIGGGQGIALVLENAA
uniref:3-ketoacyl-CoA thiolase n=1 Tax=Hyaloperonospora arabidopsidis (strain Emoy2) TaxID=559515 RepID=M4BFH5_HYAAE